MKGNIYKYIIVIDGDKDSPIGLSRKVVLKKYITEYIDSLKLGGNNEHVSKMLGYIPIPHSAELINQFTGETIDKWSASSFMIIWFSFYLYSPPECNRNNIYIYIYIYI